MLRIIVGVLFLASCSMGEIKSGGERSYTYDLKKDYSLEELKLTAPEIIVTSQRESRVGKLENLFDKKQKPLKRVGLIIFETRIQPTMGGLAGHDKIYLSEQGKQLMTEKLLRLWEEIIPLVAPDVVYVGTQKIIKAPSFDKHGAEVDDFLKVKRSRFAPDDIFFLEKGKKTTSTTVLNARKMRDLSLLLVPATELMHGPKWSEHSKHFVNDIMKELKLDAAIIVLSEINWSAAHVDKHSGESIPEEMKLRLTTSTLVSLSEYRERLKVAGINEDPKVNLCYRAYEGKMQFPVEISVPESKQNFKTIQKNVLNPLLKSYKDLTVMMIEQITKDLRATY